MGNRPASAAAHHGYAHPQIYDLPSSPMPQEHRLQRSSSFSWKPELGLPPPPSQIDALGDSIQHALVPHRPASRARSVSPATRVPSRYDLEFGGRRPPSFQRRPARCSHQRLLDRPQRAAPLSLSASACLPPPRPAGSDVHNPRFYEPVDVVGDTRLFMGGNGAVWLEAGVTEAALLGRRSDARQMRPSRTTPSATSAASRSPSLVASSSPLEAQRGVHESAEKMSLEPRITEIVHDQIFKGRDYELRPTPSPSALPPSTYPGTFAPSARHACSRCAPMRW
ncbi:hypothetical protein L1887_57569 [Cichorium endivia]|nr:hypothetical protein L1887_57569 [Cichorium endivia]